MFCFVVLGLFTSSDSLKARNVNAFFVGMSGNDQNPIFFDIFISDIVKTNKKNGHNN